MSFIETPLAALIIGIIWGTVCTLWLTSLVVTGRDLYRHDAKATEARESARKAHVDAEAVRDAEAVARYNARLKVERARKR